MQKRGGGGGGGLRTLEIRGHVGYSIFEFVKARGVG